MTPSVAGRTVFITGASRGIGRAVALAFAREGYNVGVNCVSNTVMLHELVREIGGMGAAALAAPCDVADYKAVEKAFYAVKVRFGHIGVLVNNAAVSLSGLYNLSQPEDWRRAVDVNIMGVLNSSRVALPDMLARHSGVIINMSSVWGSVGASCEAVYSMTKGAVDAFTRALAKETAPNGVRVNAIAPGVIDTDMNSFLSLGERTELAGNIPMARFGKPEEVAELALFLASERAAYLTGQVITLDGGFI